MLLLIFLGITIVSALVYSYLLIKYAKKNEIQNINKKDTIELFKLYLKIDPKDCRSKIDELIDFYLAEYAFYHFSKQEILYIKNDQAEEMIKTVTETTFINLSDL